MSTRTQEPLKLEHVALVFCGRCRLPEDLPDRIVLVGYVTAGKQANGKHDSLGMILDVDLLLECGLRRSLC